MNELYLDEPAKWKTRILHQIHAADPVDMDRKSCLYTILEYCVYWATFGPYRLDQLYVFCAIHILVSYFAG